MRYVQHQIQLDSTSGYGRRVPPRATGALLMVIPTVIQRAIRMRFEGRSTAVGRQAVWLESASDVRFIDHYGEETTTLVFEAPVLGEAAEEIYRQPDMFTPLPRPEDTGFDLLGDILVDVAEGNGESDRFDVPLLNQIGHFQKGLDGDFQRASFWGNRFEEGASVHIDSDVIEIARQLRENTPSPRRLRISGVLDMIRASTLGFALKLADGQEVRGVLQQGNADKLHEHFQREIVVLGKAVYRSSGRLLRIDADEMSPASEADRFYSEIPKPTRKRLDLKEIVREQQHKKGLAAILGEWPGDESDEEVERALEEVS